MDPSMITDAAVAPFDRLFFKNMQYLFQPPVNIIYSFEKFIMYIVAVIAVAVNRGQKKRANWPFLINNKITSESDFANWGHNAQPSTVWLYVRHWQSYRISREKKIS
jgi:hypothetical protein